MNTMLKRIVSLVLCLVMVAGYVPVNAFADETGETVVTAAAEATNAPSVVELSDEATGVVAEEAAEAEENEEESLTADTGDPEEAVSEEETTSEEAPAEEETSEEVTSEEETTEEETSEEAAEEAAAFELEGDSVDVPLLDAAGTTYVLACSDFQNKSGDSAGANTVSSILGVIDNTYTTMNGFLFAGDLSQNLSTSASKSGKAALQKAVQKVYGTGMHEVYVQGNHDPDDTVGSVCSASGKNDPTSNAYGVFVINEKDYPWGYNANDNTQKATIQATANALDAYLDEKVKAGYSNPIFVVSHLPLHYSPRTVSQGDGKYAKYIYDVLDEAGDAGLNIIFMFGHNHSSTYDDYLGGSAIYLAKGKTITIAKENQSYTDTLSFTYMNSGYVGYSGSNADSAMTMTVFAISDNQVTVNRYDTQGEHLLKAQGVTTSNAPTADTTTVKSGATIALTTPTGGSGDSGDDNTGSGGNEGSGSTGGSTGGSAVSGNVYTLVDTMVDGGEYLIVSSNADGDAYAMKNPGGTSGGAKMGATAVNIENSTITIDDTDVIWKATAAPTGFDLTNGSDYLEGKSGHVKIFNSSLYPDRGWSYTNNQLTETSGDNKYNVYYSDGFTYSTSLGSNKVYIFQRTSGTGSGGGSTVTPGGGDWVTITAPSGGTTTYAYTLVNSITAGNEYVIVGNDHAVALMNNNSNIGSQTVTINGNSMTSTVELTEWKFESKSKGTISNSGEYLRYKSSGYSGYYDISGTAADVNITDNGSNFRLYSGNASLYYSGSEWTDYNGTRYVRLYQRNEAGDTTTGGTAGLFAKITGKLEYNVERGLTVEQVIALVQAQIKGYEYSGTTAPGADVTGTEITGQLEFVLDANYDGSKAGEYSVAIKYKVVTLGTAKVIVPEVAITGHDCQTSGSVKVGATGKTRTGANITVNLEDGTSYTVPVTLDMLSGDFTTETAGKYTELIVTYNGEVVCENFTLTVREPSSYPEYPDEGAVKVNKTGTGVQFQSTGVAQVEVSASGIPMNQGVDVLLVLDTSSSMGMEGSLTDGRTRIDVLKECVNALIANLQHERADGSVPDVQMAVVHFNGYTGNKNTNYISSTARDTDTLGGTLTDDGKGGAWVDVQNMGSNWASIIPDDCSGTNYDHGLLQAYDLLSARQTEESSRKQFVLFMSDGAPFQYNGVNSGSIDKNGDWAEWILGSHTQAEVEDLSHVKNPEFYYGNNGGNGQKHRVAEAIKGTGSFDIVTYSNTDSSGVAKLETVPGLGITMYSVGLALEGTNMPTDVAGQEAILRTIASSDDVFYSVTSAAGLQGAFDDFAGEVLMAATDARFVDQMGDAYNLKMGQIKDLHGNAVEGVENKIEILSYAIWTRADYLANKCALDQIGDRKLNTDGKPIATVLETVTFNADGTEAYSDKINNKQTNILVDGVICAQNFWYNTTSAGVVIDGVDIPTGVGSNDLTTGTSNVLPAETFYWKVGTIKTTELAMRYYVYLDGSMEGTRDAGSYPTNEYAILYYNNYLNQPAGQPCHKDTASPVMAWDAANVSYAFYLVDENGNIIVNQTTGETGSFANKIAVTSPVVYEEVLLNNTDTVESIEVASTGVLPDGYELYDNASVYTIRINSDATGSWNIAKGTEKATTYVTHFDLNNPTAYSSEMSKSADADFTHTIVWFAVVWKVQALPDSVVIDYGLPVDISVLTNDMFGENGKLAAVGSAEGVNLDSHNKDALHANFLVEGQPKTSYQAEYGTAQANTTTGKVRYTPANMQMNGYEKFAYAVNYSGNENAGYYYDTVTVIPATTIYYEDIFVTLTSETKAGDTWTTDNPTAWTNAYEENYEENYEDVDVTQAEDRPGKYSLSQIDANNIYGYDSAYSSMSQYSLGSAKKITVNANKRGIATFTFYGTGFDVIGLTSNDTGTLTVQVYSGSAVSDTAVKTSIVDTYYAYTQNEDGEWEVNNNAENPLYQVPVMKISGLTYGQYTVKITAGYNEFFDHDTTSLAYDLYLDSIRIYDPANDGASDSTTDTTIEDAYAADGEGWPSYFELRNKLISTETLGNDATTTEIVGEVFIDGDADVGDGELQDYTSYGPNNEVYLAKDQSIAFMLSDVSGADGKTIVAQIHLGIKSANGEAVTYTIKNVAKQSVADKYDAGHIFNVKTATVSTTTDMYYNITGYRNDIIVITNDSDGILSLTNIKATYTRNPNGIALQSEDSNITVASETGSGDQPAANEVYAFMTPNAAKLTVRALNASAGEDIPEPSVPETTIPPETTVPETTVPETTVPETTEPEETKPVKPDNSELKAAVEEARKIKQKGHTQASFKKLQTAIKAAEKVLKDKKATQAQIDKALADLNAAVDALETVEVKPIGPKPGTSGGKFENNFMGLDFIMNIFRNLLKGNKK